MEEEYSPQVDQVTELAPPREIHLQNLGCELQVFLLCPSSILKLRMLCTHSVGQNVILSHASAVKVYREVFKPVQKGQIGITLNGDWQMPYDDNPESAHIFLFVSERLNESLYRCCSSPTCSRCCNR